MIDKLVFSGVNADYYEYEKSKIVKLFKKGEKVEFVLNEYNKALELCSINDLAPKAVSMAKELGREGIVYEMIKGNTVLDLAINAADPIYCAKVLKEVIEKVSNTASVKLPSYKEVLEKGIKKALDSKEITKDVYNEAMSILKGLKNSGAVCNSMIEPNNIVLNKGTMIIPEWDLACVGPVEYEVARIFVYLKTRKYPEKGYAERSVKEFLKYTYQALVKELGYDINEIKDYIYVVCVAMLGEYVEYGSDDLIKNYVINGDF